MKRSILTLGIITIAIFLISAGPKSPQKFYEIFPTLTKSTFIKLGDIDKLVKDNKCMLITEKRTYAAPVAGSIKGDMKKGAKGVDELVQIDGGNSYVLKNYAWKNFDSWGSTQLHLEFDTYLCK